MSNLETPLAERIGKQIRGFGRPERKSFLSEALPVIPSIRSINIPIEKVKDFNNAYKELTCYLSTLIDIEEDRLNDFYLMRFAINYEILKAENKKLRKALEYYRDNEDGGVATGTLKELEG